MQNFSLLDQNEIQKIVYNLILAEEQKQMVLITSHSEQEGKTSVAFGLGMELAKVGKKVLYVGFEPMSFLEGEIKKEEILGSNLSNLDILIKENYVYDIEKYKDEYQFILVDTPAMSETKAAIDFADKSDIVLLVVEANRNSYKNIQECKKELTIGNCKDIRVVLNKTRKTYGVLKKFRKAKRNQ